MAEYWNGYVHCRRRCMNRADRNKILAALGIPFIVTLLAWISWLVFSPEVVAWGIHPRNFMGLRGILFAPLIHDPSTISHLLNNSIPLLFLGWALYYFYPELANRVFAFIWFFSGFWVWLAVKDDSYHIGASGIVYGLASFLFYSGIIRKQTNLLGLTMLVTFLYGGMVWGIFPYDLSISWQGHLFGGIMGLVLAIYYRKEGWQREKYEWETEPLHETFSELNQRHEAVLSGKIPDPNLPVELPPHIVVNYEIVEGNKKD